MVNSTIIMFNFKCLRWVVEGTKKVWSFLRKRVVSIVYRTRHLSPLLVAMAQTPPSASSSSNFQAILYSSLKTYEKKTKQNLLAHPLMAQLQTCTSPTDILHVLRTQVQQFEQSTSDDDKLTRWLNPTVNVLYAFSSALGAGIGLVNPIRTVLLRSNVWHHISRYSHLQMWYLPVPVSSSW